MEKEPEFGMVLCVRRGRCSVAVQLAAVAFVLCAVGCGMPGKSLVDQDRRHAIDVLYGRYRKSFPTVQEMTAAQLSHALSTTRVVVVDVREPAERAVSMIAGAISAADFERSADQYRDTVVVTYCTIGYRSGLYAARLDAQGYRVRNLKGGLLAWAHAGQALVGPDGPTRRVHVYGKRWDLLPAGYEAVLGAGPVDAAPTPGGSQ